MGIERANRIRIKLGLEPLTALATTPQLPKVRILEKASNFARAGGRVASVVLSGKKIAVSPEEQTQRLAICANCEFFTGITCQKCGCVIRFKSKLVTEHCPIGKW